jgi:Lipase (class 3)
MSFSPFSLDGLSPNDAAVIEQLALANVVWYNRTDFLPAIAAAVGPVQILYFHYDPDSFPPTRMIVRSENNLYIHIGGTNQEFRGNISNIMGAVAPWQFWPTGTFTNTIWAVYVTRILPELMAALPAGWQQMNLGFVGHSQGGPVSYLIACLLANTNPGLVWDWFGYASPRVAAGARLTAPNLPRYGYVLINQGDIVPSVPPDTSLASVSTEGIIRAVTWGNAFRWYHPCQRWTYQANGTRTRNILTGFDAPLTPSGLVNVGNYHPVQRYNATLASYWRANNP